MEKQFYHSKKFWAAVVATAVPMLNHHFGWGWDADHITTIVTPMIAYILGQGLADLGKNKR
ncbi:MAG: hypothetical protein CMO74_14590 [Verrucomicrobiales bacterium]|nr:hypothetical protein [Verrucomicrobiales bacterium]|tara:strand:+ start:34074 stop:34256 length:183 start_codon:yes stop_codon:yes gene_type:complete